MEQVVATTLASSGEGGSAFFGLVLFAVPFVVGWFTYSTFYRRYRNPDKRYLFEHTTAAARTNLQRWDTFVREHKRQRNAKIKDRNDDEPLRRAPHSRVREALEPRQAQEERVALEAREAQPPRDAQPARDAQPPRDAQTDRTAEPEREDSVGGAHAGVDDATGTPPAAGETRHDGDLDEGPWTPRG
ncbi:hypothetical protein [uncultured Demequina sp.]|uniref:hypothetical protein n=1 Tax=uncultured Demequina sp. TaxID=693499 RepID=UPI0025E24A6F|nr:hypothetical protein [uncultured Demequina sp.]